MAHQLLNLSRSPPLTTAPLNCSSLRFGTATPNQHVHHSWASLHRSLNCNPRFTCLFSHNNRKQEQAKKALESALGGKKTEFEKWDKEIQKRTEAGGGGDAGGGGWFRWGRWFGGSNGDHFWQEAQQTSLAVLGIILMAIQHAHSFSVQMFQTRGELADLKREFANIHKQNRALQVKMQKLEEQAEAAVKAKQIADEKADAAEALKKVAVSQQKEAEERAAEAEKELQEALANKKTEVEAAYNDGMADVAEDYKLQVMKACNKGFVLGWNALSKNLNLPADSPFRKTKAMRLPCPLPPSPTQSEEETEPEAEAEDEVEDGEALVRKPKDATGAKSSSQGNEVLDLTQEEDELVAEETAPEQTTSDAPQTEKRLDETLAEIDAEVAADKEAEVVVEEQSEVPPQPSVNAEEN